MFIKHCWTLSFVCFSLQIIYAAFSSKWQVHEWLLCLAPLLSHAFRSASHHLLRWRRNERDGVSNHQPHDCLLKRLFGRRSKKASKLRVTGLCVGNSPGTGEFPGQMASDAENASIWWRHRDCGRLISSDWSEIYPYCWEIMQTNQWQIT